MKHEENISGGSNQPEIPAELEARIVAWVLGEASAFEAAELERLCAAQLELAIFKRRIEAVHGLVGEAERPLAASERESLQLAPEKRAKLLTAIGAPSATMLPAAAAPAAAPAVPQLGRRQANWRTWAMPLAACLMLALLIGGLVLPTHFGMSMKEAESIRREVASTQEKRRAETAANAERQRRIADEKLTQEKQVALVAGEAKPDALIARDFSMPAPSLAAPPPQAPLPLQGAPLLDQVAPPSRFNDAKNFDLGSGAGATFNAPATAAAPDNANQSWNYGTALRNDGFSSSSIGGTISGTGSVTTGGYFSTSTIAGTRLNSNVEQLKLGVSATEKDAGGLAKIENKKEAEIVTLSAFTVASSADADKPLPRAKAAAASASSLRNEVAAARAPVSTFSLHVGDVSYRLARETLARGQRPDATAIRPEEFYNAFDYGDPAPLAGEPVAAHIEQAAHPFLQQHNLLRIALKVPATGRGASQPLRLTILLDTSGSMEREDRVASVRRALEVLAPLLNANDRVTLIGFARTPRLIADRLAGNDAAKLAELARRIPAEGGTNLEEALKLATERARAQFDAAAQNRIVLLTDGAANLGNADPAQLAAAVTALRQQGIAFDACGIGLNGLDDSMLETLTRQGDGRYYAINSPDEADANFARQLAGAFRPAARDVKVQVRFNPARVRAYRLIGFEQHRLREEDFRNDAIDAAELAAGEAATALYEIEPLPQGEGELGEVAVRFRRGDRGEIVERSWTLAYAAQPAAFDRATPSLQLAGTAALLAEKLRGGAPAAAIRLGELAPVVSAVRGAYAQDRRVQDFVTMFNQARRVIGE